MNFFEEIKSKYKPITYYRDSHILLLVFLEDSDFTRKYVASVGRFKGPDISEAAHQVLRYLEEMSLYEGV